MSEFWIVNSEHSKAQFIGQVNELFAKHKWVRFDWIAGSARSLKQNALAFEIFKRVAIQLYGGDIEHARAEAKLQLGVPLLRRDLPRFREVYDRTLRPLDYETKLEFIKATDMPVTRLMTVKTMGEFIDLAVVKYEQQGVHFGDLLQLFEHKREAA